MNKLTMGSLFDGIGGFILAGNQVGIDTLWSSEIDPACEAVTKFHFPTVAQMGDITKIDGAKVPPVDIICGGSPCQDLSVAGKRAGLAGERSGLYMEQIRIIREMRAATNNTYPRYMVWENVPGALSSNKGDDFRAVLEEAARCADKTVSIPESKKWSNAGCIVGNGWSIAWRILDAQFWGVPQRRRRIFLVADFGGECAGEVLFKPEGLRGDSSQGGEAREGTAADVEGSVGGSGGTKCFAIDALSSNSMKSKNPHSGFHEENYVKCLDTTDPNPSKNQGGNVIVQEVKYLNPSMPQSSRIYGARGIYPALSANESGGQNRQAVIYPDAPIRSLCARADSSPCIDRGQPFVVFTQNQRDEVRDLNGVTAALAAESGMHQTNYVCEPVAAFMGGQGAKARTIAYSENVSPSLKSVPSGGNTVPDIVYPLVTGTICSSGAGTSRPAGQCNETDLCIVMATGQANSEIYINKSTTLNCVSEKPILFSKSKSLSRKYIIRRLTPLECERLQGYSDGWTDIRYKNKPMSDSARYRMCGNSVAIPCVVRVLGGIVEIQNKNV